MRKKKRKGRGRGEEGLYEKQGREEEEEEKERGGLRGEEKQKRIRREGVGGVRGEGACWVGYGHRGWGKREIGSRRIEGLKKKIK